MDTALRLTCRAITITTTITTAATITAWARRNR